MKGLLLFLAASLLFPAAAPLLQGQKVDLMALKKQEEERRKKLGASKAKVTNDNLGSIATGGKKYGFVQMEAEEPPADEAAAAPGPEARKEDPARRPEYWKNQQDQLQQRIAQLKAEIEGEQSRLNRLWSDFYVKSVAAEQEAIRAQIAQLTNQIEQKRLMAAEAETQLQELFEKARKAGVPPGWLR